MRIRRFNSFLVLLPAFGLVAGFAACGNEFQAETLGPGRGADGGGIGVDAGQDAGVRVIGPPGSGGGSAADADLDGFSVSPGRGDAGPCTPDTTFGEGGVVFSPFVDGGVMFSAALFQENALLATDVGSSLSPGPAHVTRFTLDGRLDSTFNSGAPVVLNFGTGAEELLTGALQQRDGKIVVYGFSFAGGGGRGLVARLNADGTLDTGFAANGMITNLPPYQNPTFGAARLFSAIEQPNGDLLFGGSNSSGAGSWYLMRVSSSGVLDPTMGDAGFADQSATTTGTPFGVAAESDGRLLLFGQLYDSVNGQYVGRWGVERYSNSGVLDPYYASSGLAKIDVGQGLNAMGIQVGRLDTTDRLAVAGASATDAGAIFAAGRFATTGLLDFGFNSGQLQTIPLGSGSPASLNSLLVDTNDRFVLSGTSPLGATVVRLNSDGSRDMTCGDAGVAIAPITLSAYSNVAAAFDSDGRLLLAGQGTNGTSTGLWFARLWM